MPALDASEIESADPNAWTGKTTSLAYQGEGVVSAFLTRRGFTAYGGLGSDNDKAAALVVATEVAEDALRSFFAGSAVNRDQRLLFPALGAYDSRGNLILPNEAPAAYLEGIALLAEAKAAGTLMPATGKATGLKRQEGPDLELEYFQVDRVSLKAQHPDIWWRISAAFPKAFL
jgi:hypothetical protein